MVTLVLALRSIKFSNTRVCGNNMLWTNKVWKSLSCLWTTRLMARTKLSVAVTHWSRSTYYCTLGPVSAWVGDRLSTDKPPRRRTRHPALLSLSIPTVVGGNEYPTKAGGVNRHIAWYTSPYLQSWSVGWWLSHDHRRHVREAVAH